MKLLGAQRVTQEAYVGKWTERDLKIGCIYFSKVNCVHGSKFKHYQRVASEIPPQPP